MLMSKELLKCRQWFLSAACIIFAISSLSVPVFADQSGSCGNDVSWTLTDGIMVISGNGRMNDYSSDVKPPWKDVRDEIVEVIVSEGVVSIGNYSFHDCNNLSNVSTSNSIKEIGGYAFAGCENLKTVTFGDNLEFIGEYSFKNDESLQNVVLPESLLSIGYEAFYRCKVFTDITIPSSVTYLGNCIFSYCTNLKRAIINANVNQIPAWMFYGCDNLITVSFSNPVIEVGDLSFYDCDSLRKVYIKASNEVIDELNRQIKSEASSTSEVIQSEYVPSEYEEEIINSSSNDDVLFSQTTTDSNVTVNAEIVMKDDSYQMNLETSVSENNQWDTVIEKVNAFEKFNENIEEKSDRLNVTINVDSDVRVNKEIFSSLSGKAIDLIMKSNGAYFILDCESLSDVSSFANVELGYELTPVERRTSDIEKVIQNSKAYFLKFKGACDYQLKVKLFVGLEYARNYASLYQKNGKKWNLVHSVQIDYEGYATFYLAGYDSLTDYLIGLNVDGVNITKSS